MSEKKPDTLDGLACSYILEHYLEPDLDRHRIAAVLGCSTRNLSRTFEGSAIKLHAYIRLLRLHKGRELLRKRPHLTIEQIADKLHFSSAKHFATRYREAFHLSPSEERKSIHRRGSRKK